MSATFLNDEVGSVVGHSDVPNVRMQTFVHSEQGQLTPYTLMWPIQDISENEAFLRDRLYGFDESRFRSARLRLWFETPDDYYKKQLEIWRAIKLDDIEGINAQM